MRRLGFATVLMCMLMAMSFPFTVGAATLRGDVSNDGNVNIEDVTDLIGYLLTGDASGISLTNADTDLDGKVTINDITTMIDYLLTGAWEDTPAPAGDWVDLGLPSGTLWATCNVGASAPEEYGDYFAWGETEPKDVYNLENYKWYQSYTDENGYWHYGYTKYCICSGLDGFVDYKTELDPEDDAAYVNWGPSWRTPTIEQLLELPEKCSSTWTTRNGVNGRLFTGPNGKTLFLPAAEERSQDSLDDSGSWGFYWSRTLSNLPDHAYTLRFNSDYVDWLYTIRYGGFVVRAVRVSQN